MTHILLINPNTSTATTQMMVDIARTYLASVMSSPPMVVGATVTRGAPMIVDEQDLVVAAEAVNEPQIVALAAQADGVIVGAFGDPGIEALRARLEVPVVGIGASSVREAAAGGRRFGIATTTPMLAHSIASNVHKLGFGATFTGSRFTSGDPLALGGVPSQLESRLARAVDACIQQDGARAVVIGGGPLGEAAQALGEQFSIPVIGPVPAACRALIQAMRLGEAA
ncbi:aspartate/glutamate racemase family protein [Pandoraea fibrosis]|uniref:Aspartate/glutamate racemase family protein n=1 Tax=Pandoraea fibrosis TaxID=1891094 RepID=A0ABX6HMT5_9BURK|nr:aspartate/glutamate racemase family protein [Pandoraea fibrosis]QHE94236.1 aspartate/glutamate racemase family protein [Pandoraea fibrosis]QHF12200.1 aspartate/glutamate racemase family protein [Pandoraea fibrosis]